MLQSSPHREFWSAVSTSKATDWILIGAVCLALYLAGNGRISLWDRDEAWYAETAREMTQRGDYVVPTFNAQPRYRKPVLIYWLMAAAYSVFGDNEFGARFFSGVAGTITCLLTYRLGTRMGGRATGLAAGLMLSVAPFMVIESKLATTDAVLTATIVAAMSCLWELHHSGFSWRWSLALWFLIGVMMLTKGPFGPVFLALAVASWLLLNRQGRLLHRLNWLPGLAVAAAVCLPWGVAIYVATDGEFYRVAFGEQALGHSFSAINGHRGFPGFYLAITLAGVLPWTFLLPLGLAGVTRWAREDGPGSYLIGWMVGPMILLEIMRTKLPQYYLPAFPAWTLLIARGLVQFHTAGLRLAQAAGSRRVYAPGAIGIAGATVLAVLAITHGPTELRSPALAVAALAGFGSCASLVLLLQRRDLLAWATTVGTWWSLGMIGSTWLLPNAETCRVARIAADALRDLTDQRSTAVLFGYREPSLVFYVGRPMPTFSSPHEVAEFLRERGPVTTLLRDSELRKLRKLPEIVVEPCAQVEARPIRGLKNAAVLVARLSTDAEGRGQRSEVRDQRSDGRRERIY